MLNTIERPPTIDRGQSVDVIYLEVAKRTYYSY